jgi:hypothetical protein
MHIRRGFLGWGVFLILTGAVPLLVRAGYLTDDQLARLWTLWPLILVGIGIGLVLSRTRFDFIGGLIVAATFGLMAGGLLSSGVGAFSFGGCGRESGTKAFPARDGTIASNAAVELGMDCGIVNVGVGLGAAWRVEGQSADGNAPEISATGGKLSVRSSDDAQGPLAVFGPRETWRVTIPNAFPVDLDVHMNAGEAKLDLSGGVLGDLVAEVNGGAATIDLASVERIESMKIGLNAGSVGLTLPNLSLTGSIEANAGSVKICAPAGAGLRLQTGDSIVASYDYGGHGLVQDGSTWTTPGFATAAVRIDLRTTANAGSFALDPEDGCG